MSVDFSVKEIVDSLKEQWDDGLISSIEVNENLSTIIDGLSNFNDSLNHKDINTLIIKLTVIQNEFIDHVNEQYDCVE